MNLKEFAENNAPKPCDIIISRGKAHYIDDGKIIGGCSEDAGIFQYWEGDTLDCGEYDYIMELYNFV